MANRIEIIITAKEDADVRKIGQRIEKSVAAGAKNAGGKLDKELTDGARKAGDHVEQELGKAGSDAGTTFSRSFTNKAGQLRDARGRFAKAGAAMGGAAAAGAGRAMKGGLARAGSQAGSAAASGVRRSFVARVGGMLGSVGRRVGHTFGIHFGAAADDAGEAAGRNAVKGFANIFEGGITSPMILTPLIAAGAAAAPVAGAAIAAGVVMAFGAGLGVLGLVAASKLKGVQKEIRGFKKFSIGFLKDIGKPMRGAFDTMLTSAKNVMQTLRPILKGAFKDFISPAMKTFFTDLSYAMANLGPAIRPVSKAFKDLMTALGPQLPGLFKQIADAIIDISTTISSNPDLFANIISGLLQLIPLALQITSVLANAYVAISKFTGTKSFWKNLLDVLSPLAALIDHFGGLGNILDKIKDFFSGFGKIKTPRMSLGALSIKDNASKVIRKVKSLASGLVKRSWRAVLTAKNLATKSINAAKRGAQIFARATYRATMRAVNRAGAAISAARKLATRFARATYRATMRAVNRAGSAVNAARNMARRFARATYRAVLTARNAVASAVNSAIAMARRWAGRVFTATLRVVKSFNPFEHGGVVSGKATGGVSAAASGGGRGGTVLVGESGPELVNLPGGSHVRSNADTKRHLTNLPSPSGMSKSALVKVIADGIAKSGLASKIVNGLGAKLQAYDGGGSGGSSSGGSSSSSKTPAKKKPKDPGGDLLHITTKKKPKGRQAAIGATPRKKKRKPKGRQAAIGVSGGRRAAIGVSGGRRAAIGVTPTKKKSSSHASTSSSSSGQPIHITLQIGEKGLGDVMIDPLRKAIKVRGGIVQAVLGSK